MKIHVTEIYDSNGVVATHYVRHKSTRSAQAFALEHKVTTRVASQDDIIAMVRSGAPIIGMEEDKDARKDSLPLE